MTWEDLSRDNLACAQRLYDQDEVASWRSVVSRAYYAAYAAGASHVCRPGVVFNHGWNNPPHEDLPHLLANVGALPVSARKGAKRGLRILREARTDADYRPGRTIMREEALRCIQEAVSVLHHLEVLK